MLKTRGLFILSFITFTVNLVWGQKDFITFEKTYRIQGNQLEINLDIDGAKLVVEPNDQPDQCYVYIRHRGEKADHSVEYNLNRNQLDISMDYDFDWDHDGDEDDADQDRNEHHEHKGDAFITLKLPTEPRLDLNSRIKAGEINFNLGGIHLENFELTNWAGEVSIDFPKPNLGRLKLLDVNVKVGELNIQNLGNANCEEALIDGGIGSMNIDFRGQSIKGLQAEIDLDLGETTLTVPADVGTKMRVSKFLFLSEVNYPQWFDRRGKYYYSENYREGGKNLNLDISTGIGELKVRVK